MPSWARSHGSEFVVALALASIAVGIGLTNPVFFSLENLFDLLRNSIVIGILSLGVLVALVSGGIDVSFTAIAAFSFYATIRLLLFWDYQGSVLPAFLLAMLVGTFLGAINGLLIGFFRLPTLIVTLGTLSLFRGLMLTLIGSEYITVLPVGLIRFSRASLFEALSDSGAQYRLPMAFLLLIGAALLTAFVLKYTLLGRGVYALGGSAVAAARVGFNVFWIQLFIYSFIGFLSGAAGLTHAVLARMANPFDLVGTELNVIAAVVLGGARITGGYGSVTGTLLGVCLIVVINSSLILMGVPSYWQKIAIGILILLGTGMSVLFACRRKVQDA